MADKWHDINHPGVWRKPDQDKPDPGTTTPADNTADDAPPENKQPLVKLSEGKFVPPDEGAEINKKCPVQVNVEYLDDSAKSMQKVTFSLYANYNDTTSNLSHYVDGYEQDGVATAEMTMYPPPDYQDGDSVDYFFKAEHIRGEKVIDSEDLTLPQDTQTIVLQKGDYDENGAQAYNKDQSGDNFKPNNVVKKLQGDLITTNFLPQGSDDGFFGDQSDKAVNDFQDYAIKLVRMKRSVGKTENTDTGLDQESPDGIVGGKTRDELDKWLQNDWIKPIPTLRHGEYDDTGVDNGKGKKGTDDHHLGTPVVEAQNNLQKVGVYSDGAVDGWFYDKMLDAVKLFQDAASKGQFIINEVLTDIGEKLSGYQKGEHCAKTQEYLKKVVDKGGKVQKEDKIGLEIKSIVLPNEKVSFTTQDGENEIQVTATISSSDIPKEQEKEIEWEIQSDPDAEYKAVVPENKDIKGNDVKIKIDIPKEPNGRQWKAIKYQLRAKLTYNGQSYVSDWKKIGQDEKDILRQQYVDMSKNALPDRSQFINTGKSEYFTLTEGACSCGNHSFHIWSIMSNLDEVRKALSQSITVNSGYRCPQKNAETSGSAKESQHMYGKAADIAVMDFNKDGSTDKKDWDLIESSARKNGMATYTEPYEKTGTWVHMDWR